MRIAKSTDYALRLLMYTSFYEDKLATLSKVSKFFDISHEHLRKVVHELGIAGFLDTYRGRNGGFKLAREPKDINLGEVVSLFEGRTPIIDCDKIECPISPFCLLRGILDEAELSFINTLKKYSLADVLRNNDLRKFLTVEASPKQTESVALQS